MRITGIHDLRYTVLQRMTLGALPRTGAPTTEAVAPLPAPVPHQQAQASVAMLVAIAASDPKARRRRNTVAAEGGLRALETLFHELRVGPPNAGRMRTIAAWMDDHAMPDDPVAAELLREVELRVLVELAKAERDA